MPLITVENQWSKELIITCRSSGRAVGIEHIDIYIYAYTLVCEMLVMWMLSDDSYFFILANWYYMYLYKCIYKQITHLCKTPALLASSPPLLRIHVIIIKIAIFTKYRLYRIAEGHITVPLLNTSSFTFISYVVVLNHLTDGDFKDQSGKIECKLEIKEKATL